MTGSVRNANCSKSPHVLVVDDDLPVAETLAAILRSCGCQVTIAENGLHGLGICRQSGPDVLVSDVEMPFMDGVELARNVSKLCPSCKIILCSGTAIVDTVVPCPEAHEGYFPLLSKPMNPRVLVAMVLGSRRDRNVTIRVA